MKSLAAAHTRDVIIYAIAGPFSDLLRDIKCQDRGGGCDSINERLSCHRISLIFAAARKTLQFIFVK